jgi:hypothetical protein
MSFWNGRSPLPLLISGLSRRRLRDGSNVALSFRSLISSLKTFARLGTRRFAPAMPTPTSFSFTFPAYLTCPSSLALTEDFPKATMIENDARRPLCEITVSVIPFVLVPKKGLTAYLENS